MCVAHGLGGEVDGILSVQADCFYLVCGKTAVSSVEATGQFILEDSPNTAVITELRLGQSGRC